jgi:hypothetical protein
MSLMFVSFGIVDYIGGGGGRGAKDWKEKLRWEMEVAAG